MSIENRSFLGGIPKTQTEDTGYSFPQQRDFSAAYETSSGRAWMGAKDIEGPGWRQSQGTRHLEGEKGPTPWGLLAEGDDVAPQPVSEILAQTHGETVWIEAETRD